MSLLVRHERRLGTDVLTLDSQPNRNALSLALMEELLAHVGRSAVDDGARALALDHAGAVFCSGIDLRERERSRDDTGAHSRLFARLLAELWAYPKPLLGRIGGAVRGGGMGLVACCDIAVADPAASFAYSEVRVGVAPALVAALALRKVPLAPLAPMLLTGERFDSEAALRVGLVGVVAADSAAELDRLLVALRASAPRALRETKALARRVTGAEDVATLLAEMEQLSAELFASPEAAEGMAAFRERRAPTWATES